MMMTDVNVMEEKKKRSGFNERQERIGAKDYLRSEDDTGNRSRSKCVMFEGGNPKWQQFWDKSHVPILVIEFFDFAWTENEKLINCLSSGVVH